MIRKTDRKIIPIGVSDYAKMVLGNYYYVDKTLLIARIWNAAEVVLMPRPRRFGKTLNLSMMRYFFEKSTDHAAVDHEALFAQSNLLREYPDYRELMGKFPVIFLTLKDVRGSTWDDTYNKFKRIIAREYLRHSYLLNSEKIGYDYELFQSILKGKACKADFSFSLKLLSQLLFQYYGQKVIILIDEYDCPLQSAYDHTYYPEAVDFVRDLLSESLKDNIFLHKGFITGILSVAKEGIFSGLNNVRVLSIFNEEASDCYGFTEDEVQTLLEYYDRSDLRSDIKVWYDGYRFGEYVGIYNPWSVLNCIANKGVFSAYWANTSSDTLIKRFLVQASSQFKKDCELIIAGKEVSVLIDESIIMPELESSPELLWSLLLYSGYVTYESYSVVQSRKQCLLTLPNGEIKELFTNLVSGLVARMLPSHSINSFMNALIEGDVERLTDILQEFISSSISMFDVPQNHTERSYHLFILGLLVALRDTYDVDSNRESGDGRYDIMLVPKDMSRVPIIIEFKKSSKESALPVDAQKALEQIKEKKYAHALNVRGFTEYRAYGMAFCRKEVFVALEGALQT